MRAMTADDKKWRAQSDAETLSRAEEIKGDRTRHSAARQHAAKEMQRMAKVASKPAPKVTRGKK